MSSIERLHRNKVQQPPEVPVVTTVETGHQHDTPVDNHVDKTAERTETKISGRFLRRMMLAVGLLSEAVALEEITSPDNMEVAAAQAHHRTVIALDLLRDNISTTVKDGQIEEVDKTKRLLEGREPEPGVEPQARPLNEVLKERNIPQIGRELAYQDPMLRELFTFSPRSAGLDKKYIKSFLDEPAMHFLYYNNYNDMITLLEEAEISADDYAFYLELPNRHITYVFLIDGKFYPKGLGQKMSYTIHSLGVNDNSQSISNGINVSHSFSDTTNGDTSSITRAVGTAMVCEINNNVTDKK
ncbi:MAG: hypothetical protein WCV88_05165 [Patescibacteria group bacterium]